VKDSLWFCEECEEWVEPEGSCCPECGNEYLEELTPEEQESWREVFDTVAALFEHVPRYTRTKYVSPVMFPITGNGPKLFVFEGLDLLTRNR